MALNPDTHLDLAVGDGDVSGMGETELVDAIRALEDTKAKACAVQARLTRALDARVRARHADQGVPAAVRGRDVPGLVGYARRESPARGSRFLGFAHALTELPHAEAAMVAGVLSEWRAILIARETACLQPEHRAIVDARLCAPDGQGTYGFGGWGDRRLVAQARALVARLDPAAVVDRRARAEADRHVSLRPAPDTMARLSVLLPVAQGVAAYATLVRAADSVRAQGDPRSRGQVMTDTLVELVTGQATAEAVPVTVNLTVSDETLLAGGREPAWLTGYGPLTADHARELAATALADARVALRRLYARPDTGALVAMETRARMFPKALGLFLELRDQTCRTPVVQRPDPPPRPHHRPRARRPHLRDQRPGPVRAVQPHQTSPRLARHPHHRPTRAARCRDDPAHRTRRPIHRTPRAHPQQARAPDPTRILLPRLRHRVRRCLTRPTPSSSPAVTTTVDPSRPQAAQQP